MTNNVLSLLRKLIQEELRGGDLSYFKEGDPVLFGKWKNKKGVVLDVYEDEDTGEPIILIQPTKGRKPISMPLFRIRKGFSEEEDNL